MLQSFEEVVQDYPVEAILLRRRFIVVIQEVPLNITHNNDSDSVVFSITGNITGDFTQINDSVSLTDADELSVASIVIPGSVLANITDQSTSLRVVQTVFDTDALFLRRNLLLKQLPYLEIGSLLVSASVVDYKVMDLRKEELINITLTKDTVSIYMLTILYQPFLLRLLKNMLQHYSVHTGIHLPIVSHVTYYNNQ